MSPLDGRTWVAGGVAVASFGILETQALLTLSFGGRVEIGVLGPARARVPARRQEGRAGADGAADRDLPSVGELSAMAS